MRLMVGVPSRLRTLGRRAHLDAALAEGADPEQDPLLELRAQELTSDATRRAISRTIHNLLDAAEEPWHGSRPPLQADDVLAAREELVSLAERLVGPNPISPQAAALAARLVWDCASPIYAAGDFSVWEWARAIAA
jgi:hypothetical protein